MAGKTNLMWSGGRLIFFKLFKPPSCWRNWPIRNPAERQQPPYADNWHRLVKPEYSVLVGFAPISVAYPYLNRCRTRHSQPRTGWAAIFVRVTAQNIDLAGRVFRRSLLLRFAGSAVLFRKRHHHPNRENPPNVNFDFSSIGRS